MKIKFWDRLILFFGALLTAAAGIFLFVGGLQFAGVLGEALPMGTRIVCIAGGAALVLFAIYLFTLPRTLSGGRHEFIVQQTDNGELRIAVKAIENLVQKCVDMHEEIKLDSMKIRNAREGVTVDLRISLANNISIPLAVASLQKQIKQYLVASSGIEVKEVRVYVETAGGDIGDSPYLVPAGEQAAAQEKPAAEQPKAKVPLHQRIFGRPEQPANMPEPPKEEAAEAPETEEAAPEAPADENPAPEETAEEMPQAVEEALNEEAAEEAPAAEEESLPADETIIMETPDETAPETAAEPVPDEEPVKEGNEHE